MKPGTNVKTFTEITLHVPIMSNVSGIGRIMFVVSVCTWISHGNVENSIMLVLQHHGIFSANVQFAYIAHDGEAKKFLKASVKYVLGT